MTNPKNVFTSCCGTVCDRQEGLKYIEELEVALRGGLRAAVLREEGSPVEVLSKLIAECLLSDDSDPLHINSFEYQNGLQRRLDDIAHMRFLAENKETLRSKG